MSPPRPESASPDLVRLRRWSGAGGEWVVASRTPRSITVALLTCDRGEEMGRIISDDPEFMRHVEECVAGRD